MKLSKHNVALIIALCLTFSLAFSFLFTKADGCMSATLRDMTISSYTFTQVSWSENTITITVKAIPSGVDLPAGATAYFYR